MTVVIYNLRFHRTLQLCTYIWIRLLHY